MGCLKDARNDLSNVIPPTRIVEKGSFGSVAEKLDGDIRAEHHEPLQN